MRIVFVLRHTAFLRLFESTIAELGRRGHEVRIVFSEKGPRDSDREHSVALERMLAYENVSASDWEPDLRKRRATADTTVAMRQWQDYLRYFEPSFEGTPKLR